jgi:hypothetical protein
MAEPTIEVVSGIVMDASEACTQTHGIIAAKKGGKTYLGGRFFEQLHAAQAPFLAIDPVGHWSALTLAADGKSPGLSIVVVGGQRADVPLDFDQAEPVARYLVENGISAVVDVSELRREKRSQFVALFGDEVFATAKRVQRALLVGFDEFQDIAPQTGDKWARRALLMATDIVRIGRNYGLGSLMLTQRPESVSKEALNQIECMFVGGLRGPQERKTIKGWVTHKKAEVRAQLDELPTLKPGEFFLWSPSWLEKFERVKALPKWTYDSSATPKLGAVRVAAATKSKRDVAAFVAGLEKIARKPVSVDVPAGMKVAAEQIAGKLQERFERMDEDNANLVQRLADLEADHGELEQRHAQVVLDNEALLGRLRRSEVELVQLRHDARAAVEKAEQVAAGVERALDTLGSGLGMFPESVKAPPAEVKTMQLTRAPGQRDEWRANPAGPVTKAAGPVERRRALHDASKGARQTNGGGKLGKCSRALLGALVQHGTLSLQQAAVVSGYAGSSPIVIKSAGQLRTAGLVDGSNAALRLTSSGQRHPQVSKLAPLPVGEELAKHWLARLGKCERLLLTRLLASYPKDRSLERIVAGTEYTATSPIVIKSAGRLRTLQLIEGTNDSMVANGRLVG